MVTTYNVVKARTDYYIVLELHVYKGLVRVTFFRAIVFRFQKTYSVSNEVIVLTEKVTKIIFD